MKKVYISGKISGLDLKEAYNNFKEASDAVTAYYAEKGEKVQIVNMMETPRIQMSWADYLIRDLMFLKYCDAIAFMNNWNDNTYGVKVEKTFAEGLGIEQLYLDGTKVYTHPMIQDKLVSRLWEKYNQHGSLIIGYDFDHTIYDYNQEGGDYSCVIDLLKECSELGFVMCLWTTEPNKEKLEWKINYAKNLGINVDYVNESPASKLKECPKPYFNVLLDDVGGLESAFYTLSRFVRELKKKNEKECLK